jgi:tripartite-type tricarboxylate transporter receptor subunit TctC
MTRKPCRRAFARSAVASVAAIVAVAAIVSLGAWAPPALAQEYPSRPITLVVGFPPGGGVDIVARQLAPQLEAQLGQRVVVENRPGAAATNAMIHVARAAPDGYTLLMGNVGMLAAKPALYPQLPFDTARDFLPIARVVVTPLVAVVPVSVAARTLREFVDIAKAPGSAVNFGSGGTGDVNHLAGELFKLQSGAPMQHVPYKGSAPAHVDLAGGRLQLMIDGENIVQANIRDGRTRALAITSEKRSPALPDVPTVTEAGFPDLVVYGWQGVLAPAGTPAAVVQRLASEIGKALADPGLSERLSKQGTSPAFQDTAAFAGYIDSERRRWADVIRTANIKVE